MWARGDMKIQIPQKLGLTRKIPHNSSNHALQRRNLMPLWDGNVFD